MDTVQYRQAKIHDYGNIVVNGGHAIIGNAYIQQHDENLDEFKDIRKHVRDSLQFAEIDLRYDTVSDAHRRTFEWLFEEHEELQRWDNFVQWLETGQEPYLIEGKPGSGKTTLMRFICRHPRLKTHLRQTSIRTPVLVIYHFFWLAGSELQRSFKGLLATLALQLVDACSDELLEALPDKYTSHQSGSKTRTELKHWTETSLENLVEHCLTNIGYTIFVLIDALDEFDQRERPARLVLFLQRLNAHPSVKLCVSSRPLVWLEQNFKFAKKLLLHELTREDIRTYATEILDEDFQFYGDDLMSEREAILQVIVSKAEGVFLWVKYALSSMSEGIIAFDDAKSLRQRLEELPKGMEELFQHMWQRHENSNDRHKDEASIFLACGKLLPLCLLGYTIVTSAEIQEHYLNTGLPLDEDFLIQACNSTRRKLMVRTAGLLICNSSSSTHYVCSRHRMTTSTPETCSACNQEQKYLSANVMPGDTRSIHQQRLVHETSECTVNYLHRTVHDFLWETRFGLSLVTRPTVPQRDIMLLRIFTETAVLLQGFDLIDHQSLTNIISLTKECFEGVLLIHDILDQRVRSLKRVKEHPSWFYQMLISCDWHECEQYTDLIGFIIMTFRQDFNIEGLLTFLFAVRKPSAFYKGYLLCCAISYSCFGHFDDIVEFLVHGAASIFEKHRVPTIAYSSDIFALSALDRIFLILFRWFSGYQDGQVAELRHLLGLMLPRIPERATVMVPIIDFNKAGWWFTISNPSDVHMCQFEWGGRIHMYCHIYIHKFYAALMDWSPGTMTEYDPLSLIANIEYVGVTGPRVDCNENYILALSNRSAVRVNEPLEKFLLNCFQKYPRQKDMVLKHSVETIVSLSQSCPTVDLREELIDKGYILPVSHHNFVPPSLDDRCQEKILKETEVFHRWQRR